MAPNGGGVKTSLGRNMNNGGTTTRQVLKKGPWTSTEDAILMEYVKKHGEGNWNAVQRNSGLMRCGKSCRLRWANHLRPNLKKGSFSLEEERLIVELHAKLGNKWARMAAQMPGRTDNEIKNYWNTRLKRRQRAGLPIYPQDIQPQNQQENFNMSSSPFDHSQNPNYINPPLSLLDIFNPSTMKPNSINSNQFHFNNPSSPYLTNSNNNNLFRDPRVSLSLTLASSLRNSQLSSMVAPVPKTISHDLSNSMHNYPNFITTTRPFAGISSNPNGLILGMGVEHPSIQTSVPEITTSSRNNDFMKATTSSDADNYTNNIVDPRLSRGNSGLLEDLLEESQTLTRSEKIEENSCLVENNEENKEKSLVWEEYGLMKEATDAILTEESSSLNSSSGITTKETSIELATNQVDDDIMRFLDNFQVAVPVPDWSCDENEQITSNGQSFECDQIQSPNSKSAS